MKCWNPYKSKWQTGNAYPWIYRRQIIRNMLINMLLHLDCASLCVCVWMFRIVYCIAWKVASSYFVRLLKYDKAFMCTLGFIIASTDLLASPMRFISSILKSFHVMFSLSLSAYEFLYQFFYWMLHSRLTVIRIASSIFTANIFVAVVVNVKIESDHGTTSSTCIPFQRENMSQRNSCKSKIYGRWYTC